MVESSKKEGSVFAPFMWTGINSADFQADRRQPKENGQAEETRKAARGTDQGLRKWALIPFGPVAKAGSRVDITISPFLGEDTISRRQCV